MQHFAANLKALRIRTGETQADAAAAFQVPRSTYSAWENGASQPSLETLQTIQDRYQVGADVLLNSTLYAYTTDELDRILPMAYPRTRKPETLCGLSTTP
jgi:transcriptional regulator with XRE-family HTH domain